ncbi:MAG TPA: hypothetical protein VFT69_11650 [Pseudolabrys sp.]|nr:hypothetical protein [Pseudolabrys sp.]
MAGDQRESLRADPLAGNKPAIVRKRDIEDPRRGKGHRNDKRPHRGDGCESDNDIIDDRPAKSAE